MTQTANLLINHIDQNAVQQLVAANEGFDILDGSIGGKSTIDLDGLSVDQTVALATFQQNGVFLTSGAMAGALSIELPATVKKWFGFAHNASGFDVTVKPAGGAGVTLSPGDNQFLHSDGTTVIGFSDLGGGSPVNTEKTVVTVLGLGGTNDVPIGANVNPNTVEVYQNRMLMRNGAGKDYTVTESVPASGDFDQLTPEWTDALENGVDIDVYYYAPGVGNASVKSLEDDDADTKVQVEESTDEDTIRFDVAGSEVGIWDSTGLLLGTGISPTGTLHVDQSSAAGAKPVITLDQGDLSEEFIRLIGQSTTDATQSLVDAADLTTPGSIVGWFKVYIQDDQGAGPITDGVYYVPFYSAPTA